MLCTQVTTGSLCTPFARGAFGPFAIFSGDDDDEVSRSGFVVALASFSRMSTTSFSKQFRNSCASYMTIVIASLMKSEYCLCKRQRSLEKHLVHITPEQLILFLQPLYESLRRNNACFLLLGTYLRNGTQHHLTESHYHSRNYQGR